MNKRGAWDMLPGRMANDVDGQRRGRARKAFGMRILVALDGSKNATRAVQSVGQLLRTTREVSVTLFHVLEPLPPMLREHGGSEDPIREEQLGRQLRKDRKIWYRKEQKLESDILEKARRTLERTGFNAAQIHLKFGYEEDVTRSILEEARTGRYRAIVVGRHRAAGFKRFFLGGVTNRLLRQATGCMVWVVE